VTRKANKARNAAAKAFEAAVAAETDALHKQITERDLEISRLRTKLTRIATIAAGGPVVGEVQGQPAEPPQPAAAPGAKPAPTIGADGKEDFGTGLPPEQRPKAVFEPEQDSGPPGDLNPGDAQGTGRWV